MTGQKLYNGAIEIAREVVKNQADEDGIFILAMKEKPEFPQGVEYITWRVVRMTSPVIVSHQLRTAYREVYEWGTYHFTIDEAVLRFRQRIEEFKRL